VIILKYESLINNILSALYIENECDMKDTLIDLKELHDSIEENHFSFLGTLEEVIKSKANDLHICPKCQGDLEVVYDGQETSEYQGFEVAEKQYSIICTDCGYNKDIDS
jgi:uncharacterized protein YbaR (Trm112 family)